MTLFLRGPKYSVREGKTPILSANAMRTPFASLSPPLLADVRDRAILGVMAYAFARVSAVVKLQVKDYQRQGARVWLALQEKGGKHTKVPAHHQAAEYVEAYLALTGVGEQRDAPLFRSLAHRGTVLTDRPLLRANVFQWCVGAWLPSAWSVTSAAIRFVARHGHHQFPGKRRVAGSRRSYCRARFDQDDAAVRPTGADR